MTSNVLYYRNMSAVKQKLLVFGYIRIHKAQFIPIDICNLCVLWFLPTKSFKCRLKNGETISLFEYLIPTKVLYESNKCMIIEIKHKHTNRKYALKKYKNINYEALMTEIQLLIHFKHPNVISLCDTIPLTTENYFVDEIMVMMPKMDANLAQLIRSKQTLLEIHIKYIVYQILKGLDYIHSCCVVHTQIEPKNILLNTSDCHVKISGFCEAVQIYTKKEIYNANIAITRCYAAPETLLQRLTISSYVMTDTIDVWGVGCIAAELYLRKPLFQGAVTNNSLEGQLEFIYRYMGTPKGYYTAQRQARNFSNLLPQATDSAQDFIQRLLSIEPSNRMDVKTAMNDKWLKQLKRSSKGHYNASLIEFQKMKEFTAIKKFIYKELQTFYKIAPRK